ncbi:hypothetical protein NQ318_007446, partial [Aromia moschata]
QLTRFNNYLNAFDPTKSVFELTKRLENIERLWDEFGDCQSRIELLDETELNSDQRSLFEKDFYENVSQAQEYISTAQASTTTETNKPVVSSFNDLNVLNNIKLPTLKLTEFNGAYTEFTQFIDSFNALVHNNSSLSNVQKFFYLKSCLKNEPLQVISSLEVTDGNYQIALDLLKERYENKRVIINNHLKQIFDLPALYKENAVALRKLLDNFIKHTRALKNLGEQTDTWNSILIYLLSNKLDAVTKKAWEVSIASNTLPSIEDFTKFLAQRCQVLETLNPINQQNSANPNVKYSTSRTSNVKESKPNTNTQTNNENSTVTMCSANSSITPTFDTVLLSTAVVYIYNNNNEPIKCRALLDSASMSNFITRSLFEKLGLRGNNTNIPIFGINNSMSRSSTRTNAKIQSLHHSYNTVLPFFVLDNISGKIPANTIAISKINVPNNIQLADNEFNKSQHIDLLIGAQVYYDLLCVGQIKTGKNQPIFQKSKLGWLVSGPVALNQTISPQTCLLSTNDVQNQLERFWQIEETGYKPKFLTREEQICEQHFEQNCKRDENGRFTVVLPVKKEYTQIGDTKEIAIKRLISMENKFKNNENLRKCYTEFMHEYIDMNHMTKINPTEIETTNVTYYLPHHAVEKSSSVTTKLRVVFNASQLSTSGKSLNDMLLVGPNIQDDLISIITRFRTHNFVIKADIAKMYRQINIDENQRDLQRIVWRNHPDEVIDHYRLNTVTYGTASASFLATRCLKQISIDMKDSHPIASKVILNDFYMDDLITGSKNLESVKQLKNDIQNILQEYGFELRHDSTIVLSWIAAEPSTWKTFVCNRVAQIQELTSKNMWYHISSTDNPADIISRGCTPQQLIKSNLWKYGPAWLKNDETNWPISAVTYIPDIPEDRNEILAHVSTLLIDYDIINKFSCYTKLRRVTAYVLRFLNNVRSKQSERVIGSLTFKEINKATNVLVKIIESVLNSRPLCPLTSDPNDFEPLTPGHFIIGTALTSLPQEDVSSIAPYRLSDFQRHQLIIQHFWKRWSREYINTLQQRTKWQHHKANSLKPGLLVIVKEDNTPPLSWLMGRIVKTYPGRDGVVRVADIQTKNGVINRSFSKICVLPIDTV